MTIAQQVAHDFLESIEKMITANKLDVGVLDTNKLKREMQEKELENYCRKRICPICVFKEQEPCTVNKIDYGTATSEEVEESYRKMVENKNDKRRYNH